VVVVSVANLGDGVVRGSVESPVLVSVGLPAGVRVVGCKAGQVEGCGVSGFAGEGLERGKLGELTCPTGETLEQTVVCKWEGEVPAFDLLEVRVHVQVEESAVDGEQVDVDVSGGGAPDASVKRPLTVGGGEVFGVQSFGLRAEEEGGGVVTQAGSHPFQVTGSVIVDQKDTAEPVALPKELNARLPAGLIGNPTPIPSCSLGEFLTVQSLENKCPLDSVVGVAMAQVNELGSLGVVTFVTPIFNVEPSVGEPARFGFIVPGAPVFLDPSVRTGGDYGITLGSTNISQTASLLSARLTFWGVPGDPRHDEQRGIQCLEATHGFPFASCQKLQEKSPPPFLSMPTQCQTPLSTSIEAASWVRPHERLLFAGEGMGRMDGCNRLSFEPSIRTTPDGVAGSTPTGLNVDVHVPQDSVLVANGLAEANVKDITVTLPEGMAVNPASGSGLAVCTPGEVGFTGIDETGVDLFTPTVGQPFCPNASKIATAIIHSPLLPDPIEGAVYLAAETQNPFNSLFALYLVASDPVSGTVVKLAGKVSLDPNTGRITTTFEDNPQLAFEDAEIHFFGGPRAPLTTPARCATYTTQAVYTPWSGEPPVQATDSFPITTGPNNTPCPGGALPFQPGVAAGSINIQAAAYTPLTSTISRPDGNQDIKRVVFHMPPGLSGALTGVTLCGEPAASLGQCPASSLIGETTVSVGVGPDPYSVKGGRVYLTGPYEGAPFGLSIVNPVNAGPIDLAPYLQHTEQACDCLIVRAKLDIDKQTTALTVTTDPIPHLLAGVPLQIQHVNVLINRPSFTFNPTDCNPLAISSSIESWEGSTQAQSTPFQVTNCATLKFQPTLTAHTTGTPTKLGGIGLNVKLTYPKDSFGHQANIASVKVQLPRLLPSRLETLQQACIAATYEANPDSCPKASKVGTAKATTPLLPVPLTGTAYLVSHGGEAFPSLIILLHGYGVTVELVGTTFISKAGITTTTFKTTPDAPVETFELNLPPGRYSALGTNGNLCPHTTTTHKHHKTTRHTTKPNLTMPIRITAQNSATLKQNPRITPTNCTKHHTTKHTHH